MGSQALNWIDGEWCPAAGGDGATGACFDPATGDKVGTFAEGTSADAEAAIAAAGRAFETTSWAHSPRLRAQVLLDFADRLSARRSEIEAMLTRVNGKLLRESAGELSASISELRYYAGLARNLFGRHTEIEEGCYSILAREAAGVAGIIVPWNAPITLLIRSLAPAMAAGCTSVIKTAHQTCLANDLVLKCLADVPGLPNGSVNCITESGSIVAETMVASLKVDVISFTGSGGVGKRIMAAAAGTLKCLSLELGGKAPSLVFPDCNRRKAVATITAAATVMAGQMCTAAARVLVHESIADELQTDFVAAFKQIVVGPGCEPSSQMGPLIDRNNRDRILRLIETAGDHGRLLVRGCAPDGRLAVGAFVTPTLAAIKDVDSPLIQDEIFGPFLVFETFADEAEAIARANATCYGLAASVWTADHARAKRVSHALRAGTVWINSYNRLFPEAETGGYRESGFGRLHGVEGLNDFLQTKHVYYETVG
ncbi:MAG: aldehyde dehydrogenase family protein [Rhodocyclaceae bacterium]|nr:aldehyde dehydrogenase family protein [Rhodocyclaceae bacterium]